MLKDIKLLYLKLCTPISLLHMIKVRIFPIKEGRYPTDDEIKKVLRFYEKNKDEIESEMTPMINMFRKGRVTYVVDKDNNLIKG